MAWVQPDSGAEIISVVIAHFLSLGSQVGITVSFP